MHHEMRRAMEWTFANRRGVNLILCDPGDEVPCALRGVENASGPVWFIGNPRRGDLELLDLREVRRYNWTFDDPRLLGNPRPGEASWYELSQAGWFVKEGWALNPQIGGISAKLGRGPSVGPVEAKIRRRETAAIVIIGGRHVGPASSGPATVSLSLDGRPLTTIDAVPDIRYFLRRIELPAGALQGEGRFATLTVSATGGVPVSLEQFDVDDSNGVVFAFNDGWYELEHSPATGQSWRWASERANLLVHSGSADVEVEVRGESPLRYFDSPTRISIEAGPVRLQQVEAGDDFVVRATVPRKALDGSGGVLTVASSQHFTPAERGESADPRRLALRVYGVSVRAVR
jgi:hypothetical protein